ncbi:MAG: HEAT repeat domain-containing protein [Thermoanaerobaculia bacterium]
MSAPTTPTSRWKPDEPRSEEREGDDDEDAEAEPPCHLHDPDRRAGLRAGRRRTAARRSVSAALPTVLAGLRSAAAAERVAAAYRIESLGDRAAEAIPLLEALLVDDRRVESPDGCHHGRFTGGPGVWTYAISPAGAAASALAELAPASTDALRRAITGSSPVARAWAAWAFGESGDAAGGGTLLLGSLGDSEARVRSQAAEALGKVEMESATPALVARLEDESADVRQAAVEALAEIGASSARSAIEARLSDPDADVRESAADALEEIGTSASVGALERALGDPSWSVREEVLETLGEIGGPSAARAATSAADDVNANVRAEAAQILGENPSGRAIEALSSLAGDPDFRVREEAVEALGRSGDARGRAALRTAIADPHPGVRAAAAEALGELQHSGDREILEKALADGHWRVREAAVEALSELGDEAAVPAIRRLSGIRAPMFGGGGRFARRASRRRKLSASRGVLPSPAEVARHVPETIAAGRDPRCRFRGRRDAAPGQRLDGRHHGRRERRHL